MATPHYWKSLSTRDQRKLVRAFAGLNPDLKRVIARGVLEPDEWQVLRRTMKARKRTAGMRKHPGRP